MEIEITESAFTSDEEQILKAVDELRELGFIVLMDDFGNFLPIYIRQVL